jgi:hypothetical protein
MAVDAQEMGLVPMHELQTFPLFFADLSTSRSLLLTGILLLVSLEFGLVPDNLADEYWPKANIPWASMFTHL